MSIISQIGVVILIACILLVLILANKNLKAAAEEGEEFVDEWALFQERKEERRLRKEERKLERAGRREAEKSEEAFSEEKLFSEFPKSEVSEWERESGEQMAFSEEIVHAQSGQREATGITIVRFDERHHVAARYHVDRLPFRIGRSEQNDLVLDDLYVARMHAQIVRRDGAYILEDLGTQNKLYANGVVTDCVTLTDGLRVYIGNEELQFELERGRSQATKRYRNAEERHE